MLDLPEHVAVEIDARVASGEFVNASAAIVAAVVQMKSLDADGPPAGVSQAEWDAFAKSCREVSRRLDDGVERTYSLDEVREHLARRRTERAAATT